MDYTSTLIGIGLVVLTALPILYFHFAQKNKRKKFLSDFISQAAQQQVKITRHELWGNYSAIGLDEGAKKLFFLRKKGENENKALISLADVERCRSTVQRIPQNEDQVIDRLELVLSFRNSKADKALLFFSKEEDMSLSGELQLLEQWQALINAQLEGRRKVSMAG